MYRRPSIAAKAAPSTVQTLVTSGVEPPIRQARLLGPY